MKHDVMTKSGTRQIVFRVLGVGILLGCGFFMGEICAQTSASRRVSETSDDFYEVTSVKELSNLVMEDELVLSIDSYLGRNEVVKPIVEESEDVRLGRFLVIFFVIFAIMVAVFYSVMTAYLLRVSQRVHKLRIDTLSSSTSDSWVEECRRDAQKVRHYDESWDQIPDDM